MVVATSGDNQLFRVEAYFMLAGLVGCVLLQLRYLNVSLTKADALLVVPIYQVFWVRRHALLVAVV